MTPVTARRRARVGLGVAIGLNLLALYWPGGGGPPLLPGSDKVVHVAIFALVAFFAVRCGLRWPWVALVLALHAVTSELVQGIWMSRRSGDVGDVLADLVGVGAGIAAGLWTQARTRPTVTG